MDHTRRVLFESKRFKPKEFSVFGDFHINQTIFASIRLEDIGVRLLADFAFKLLPSVRYKVRTLFLLLHLLLQPVLQALEVDKSD